jgi:MFS family permease
LARLIADQEREQSPNREVPTVQRPLRLIFATPLVQLALLSMVIGYFVMAFLMVITPLHMARHDHTTGAISTVIMLHTLGMFGLSFLTGWLIDYFGRIQIIVAGALLLITSCVLAPLSTQIPILGLSLFVLGLGWNFTFVAGSSLFSDSLEAHERARAQGAGETLVALGLGISGLTVGIAFDSGDYLLVSIIGFLLSIGLLLAVWVLTRRNQQFDGRAERLKDPVGVRA